MFYECATKGFKEDSYDYAESIGESEFVLSALLGSGSVYFN